MDTILAVPMNLSDLISVHGMFQLLHVEFERKWKLLYNKESCPVAFKHCSVLLVAWVINFHLEH